MIPIHDLKRTFVPPGKCCQVGARTVGVSSASTQNIKWSNNDGLATKIYPYTSKCGIT